MSGNRTKRFSQHSLKGVAEGLGEGVLDPGVNASMSGVVLLLAAQEGMSGPSAVRDEVPRKARTR